MLFLHLSDTDSGPQDPLWLQYSNTQGLQKSCGGKGTARPLFQEVSASECLSHSLRRKTPWPLPWQAFIVFLGPLHQRWSSYVCFGWLSFADKGEGVTEYIKEGYFQCNGRSGWNRPCSISGRSSSDFGKIKILSKHLLPQGEGVLARTSLIAV